VSSRTATIFAIERYQLAGRFPPETLKAILAAYKSKKKHHEQNMEKAYEEACDFVESMRKEYAETGQHLKLLSPSSKLSFQNHIKMSKKKESFFLKQSYGNGPSTDKNEDFTSEHESYLAKQNDLKAKMSVYSRKIVKNLNMTAMNKSAM
jgi:hypothetical protein